MPTRKDTPTKEELWEKIRAIFPEIGACGIDLMVDG